MAEKKKKYKVSQTANHVSKESINKSPVPFPGGKTLVIQLLGSSSEEHPDQVFTSWIEITPDDPENFPFTINNLTISGEIEGIGSYSSNEGITFPDSPTISISLNHAISPNTSLSINLIAEDAEFEPYNHLTTWAKHESESNS